MGEESTVLWAVVIGGGIMLSLTEAFVLGAITKFVTGWPRRVWQMPLVGIGLLLIGKLLFDIKFDIMLPPHDLRALGSLSYWVSLFNPVLLGQFGNPSIYLVLFVGAITALIRGIKRLRKKFL